MIVEYLKEKGFNQSLLGQYYSVFVKNEIHIFYDIKSYKLIYNNAVFQNIETIEQIEFILEHCLGKEIESEYSKNYGRQEYNNIVYRDENDINILKLEKIQ